MYFAFLIEIGWCYFLVIGGGEHQHLDSGRIKHNRRIPQSTMVAAKLFVSLSL
jgi:hypothetical protein